jgi:hypothetical protein
MSSIQRYDLADHEFSTHAPSSDPAIQIDEVQAADQAWMPKLIVLRMISFLLPLMRRLLQSAIDADRDLTTILHHGLSYLGPIQRP